MDLNESRQAMSDQTEPTIVDGDNGQVFELTPKVATEPSSSSGLVTAIKSIVYGAAFLFLCGFVAFQVNPDLWNRVSANGVTHSAEVAVPSSCSENSCCLHASRVDVASCPNLIDVPASCCTSEELASRPPAPALPELMTEESSSSAFYSPESK